jgi:tRNA A37 threonylcarbamoyladenosine biosynthesis protein TsaE
MISNDNIVFFRTFFDNVMEAVMAANRPHYVLLDNNVFFLNGCGGTGKTFLYKLIYDALKS